MTSIRLEIDPVRLATFDVENARLRSSARGTVLVRARTKQLVGHGEACPLPGYGPDRIEETVRELTSVSALSVPIFRSPEEIFEWVAVHVREHSSAARFALETALLDILAQERHCPIWALFIEQGSANTAIPRAALLPRDGARAAASKALANGASAIKLKVGFLGATSAEVTTARDLRGAFPGVPLRLDANGAFSREQWLDFQSQLAGVELEFVEEPIRRGDLPWPETGIPFALDESLQQANWTETVRDWALSPGNCPVFVLKPTTLGGWSRCLALLASARSSGIRCIVSHAFGGGIEYAACYHLAVICQEGHSLAAGLGPHPGLAASAYRFEPNALAEVYGLGVDAHVEGDAP